MKKLILILALSLISSPSFAEEAYVPPAEASEGEGGWAVVDPVTNVVYGVIVCTNDVCGPSGIWAGKYPGNYGGCTNCNLRFQTRATADGNVAGYQGSDVKWDSSDNSFGITYEANSSDGVIKTKKKLVPSKTASDGINLGTGFVDIETKYESNTINDSTVKIEMVQPDISSPSSITVDYPAWRIFQYNSENSLKANIESDVESALVSEEEPVVSTIRFLTEKVKNFFGMLFVGNNE